MIILSGFLFWKLKTLQEWHKVNISTLMFTLHQIDAKNHRMVQVVRELEDHLIPTLSAMGSLQTSTQAAQTPIQPGLETCRDGASTASVDISVSVSSLYY